MVKSCWLRITCPSPLWVPISHGTTDFSCEEASSYPASLRNVVSLTQMPVRIWINARWEGDRGYLSTWSFHLPVKLESCHINFIVLLRHETQPKTYCLQHGYCSHLFITNIKLFVYKIFQYNNNNNNNNNNNKAFSLYFFSYIL